MRDPFLRATNRIIDRVGQYSKAVIQGREVPAVFVNPEQMGYVSQTGSSKGRRDFKQSAKVLRVKSGDAVGINPDWVVTVGGVDYYPSDWDVRDCGSTLVYLSLAATPAEASNGWR